MSSGTSSGSGAAGAAYASNGTGSGAGGTGTAAFFSQGKGWVMGDSSSDGRRACGQRHSLSRTSIPSRADTDANHTTTPCAAIRHAPADLAQWGQVSLYHVGAKKPDPRCTNHGATDVMVTAASGGQSEQIGMKKGGIDLLAMPPPLNDKLSLWPSRSVNQVRGRA